jgi:hypothetical protein
MSQVQPASSLSFSSSREHGQRVGLFSGRTTRTPEAKTFEAERAFGLQNLGNNYIAQRIQLGGMAEHIGFANGDFVQQQAQFRIAISAGGQVFQIFRGTGGAERIHAALATGDQQIKLFLGMIDSRDPIDQIADLQVRRIARVRRRCWGGPGFCGFDYHFIFRRATLGYSQNFLSVNFCTSFGNFVSLQLVRRCAYLLVSSTFDRFVFLSASGRGDSAGSQRSLAASKPGAQLRVPCRLAGICDRPTGGDYTSRHAPNHRGGFVLNDDLAARLPYRGRAARAIRSHAGQHHRQHVRAVG